MVEQMAKLPHVKEARGRGLLVGCEYDLPIALEKVKMGLHETPCADYSNRFKCKPYDSTAYCYKRRCRGNLMGIMEESINEAVEKYQKLTKAA